jgi:hypothetical protein
MQKKSYSAGPIIYPPKSNFDAIRGRFGLNQTTTTNYQSSYTPSSHISSLGIHRRGSSNGMAASGVQSTSNNPPFTTAHHQKRFSTSTLDSSTYEPNRPPVSASSLMTSNHSSALQRNSSANRRRPLSVIDPPSKLNVDPFHSSPDTHYPDRSQLEPVNENGGQDLSRYISLSCL